MRDETQGSGNVNGQPTGMPGLVVNLASLNFVLQDRDLAYTDVGRPMEITRYYNAYSTEQGIFGKGWTFTYGVYLIWWQQLAPPGGIVGPAIGGGVDVVWGTGAKKRFFGPHSDGTYTPAKGVHDALIRNTDGTYSFWSKREKLTYNFTADGILFSVADATGNTVTLTYDSGGRLTTITDAAGRNITFSYTDNQVTTITDPVGRTITFTYENGNMKTSSDLNGVTTTFTYNDPKNLLTSMSTPNGTTSFTYQDYPFGKRLASITNARGKTTQFSIDTSIKEVLVTDPLGHTTHYGYNIDWYTTYAIDPLGNKTTYGYDPNGNRTSITDANNKKTTIAYDTHGNVTSVTDPLTETTTFTYDSRDNLSDVYILPNDPLQQHYHLVYYPSSDNLHTITDPLNNVTEFFYYPNNGLLQKIRDARHKETVLTYDQYGDLETITDPLNNPPWIFTYYDRIGKVQTATDPLVHTTGFEYDPLGRLTRIIHPDATDFIIHRYCSGISGITDENDLDNGYEHNHINRLTKIIAPRPLSYETNFGYDDSGNLTSLTDPKNQTTGFEYFANNWLRKTTYPEGASESFTYDPVGNLQTVTNANNVLITYGYDDVHRLTSISAPDLSLGYTYNALGNLVTMIDATGTTNYTYDALNRLTNITYPTGQQIAYTYNEVGRITSIATPYGGVAYSYDDDNRLSAITLPNTKKVNYHYDAAGNLLEVDYPNGTAAVYAYDTRNRLTALTNYGRNNSVISTYAFTLDGVGNRAQTDLNEPMMLSYNAETTNYTYSLGNILDTAAGGGPLANRTTYTHDANGNRISKTNGPDVTSYTYDSLNRLTQTSTTGRIIQHIYNGLGQRTGEIDNGVQTNYLVDPNRILPQVLAETDASNNLIAYYVYDGMGLVAQISPDNQYYFYHYDGLGSTIAMTDNTGKVVNTYAYSPEGLVGTEETIPNSFTYVGRFGVMAEGNGLYFMRARYYDPEVERFINKNPFRYEGGINLYMYVANNPINYIDPYGLRGKTKPVPEPGEGPSETEAYITIGGHIVASTIGGIGLATGDVPLIILGAGIEAGILIYESSKATQQVKVLQQIIEQQQNGSPCEG